jgi:hypothetical protein
MPSDNLLRLLGAQRESPGLCDGVKHYERSSDRVGGDLGGFDVSFRVAMPSFL